MNSCAVFLLMSAMTVVLVTCEGSARKEGSCPQVAPSTQVCSMSCTEDIACSGALKCCRTACGGTTCVAPVNTRENGRVKPGACPPPSGPWVCSSRCGSDSECKGRSKCCKNRCGALACQMPHH